MTTILLLTGLLALVASGCATGKSRPGAPGPYGPRSSGEIGPKAGPPAIYGPRKPEKPREYGPSPVAYRPVVLVLGPGLAKGFAHAGVIRALHDAKIPIGAIFGTEMGALMGTLYAMNGSINQFEWAFLKLKEDVFAHKHGFFETSGSQPNDGEKLSDLLSHVFRHKDLSEAKIPIRVSIQTPNSSNPLVTDRGLASDVLRAAVAAPGIFEPGTWNGMPATSAQSRPLLVTEARGMDAGPVIAVAVASEAEAPGTEDALRGADLVIRPDLKGIELEDFQKKTEAAFRGKLATLKVIGEIRKLVGMPELEPEANDNLGSAAQ